MVSLRCSLIFFFFLMIRRPPRSTLSSSSAASDVYKRQASMYDVLCVPELEEEAGIKKAFHKLSKKWHPDKHMMNDDAKIRSTRMFQRVSDAYRVLSDSHRRMEYDAELALKRCEVESDLNDISFSSDLNFTNEDGDFTPRDYQWYMSQMHEPYFESFLNVNDSDDDYAWN
eukprot:TRINITY_DN5124_c0_g1_i3.p1 TRINITY_DN5124_c0_g1~~TRINITY_DN5124_c0_g1_i3.p1  ORF type:complete len:171 (-),score=69.73 TRINITY_DN5124_c0_g1_i3:301-813(-)